MPRLSALLFRLIPERWRHSIQCDLEEEASRAGRSGVARDLWLAWQVVRVAGRFGQRRLTIPVTPQRRPTLRGSLWSDMRDAVRMLVRQPGSAAAIVITLGIGIGIVTSVYAVFNHVLFRPVPGVRDDGQLMTMLFHPAGKLDHLGAGSPLALPLLRQASTLESVASKWETRLPVAATPNADPDIRHVQFVTSRFFDVLGVRARHGRLFSDEEAEGSGSIALLSDSFWIRELGADKGALGRSLVVNGQPFTIVGIVEHFRGWDATRVGQVDVWLPIGVQQMATKTTSTDWNLDDVIARRRAGASLEAEGAEVQGIYAAASSSFNTFTRQFVPVAYPGLYAFGQDRSRDGIIRTFPFLMGGAVLLLLVACANTANLLLARMRRRTRALALQAALGASRIRLVRGLLAEALVLAAVASAAGLAIAVVITRLLRGLRIFVSVPEVVDLALDARVTVFAFGVAAATVLVYGLLPSVRASRAWGCNSG